VSNHDSYSDFLCALSTSTIGSVSHPAGDRPSHPICETGVIGNWESGKRPVTRLGPRSQRYTLILTRGFRRRSLLEIAALLLFARQIDMEERGRQRLPLLLY
jgi:hypothetical protein